MARGKATGSQKHTACAATESRSSLPPARLSRLNATSDGRASVYRFPSISFKSRILSSK